MTDKTCKYGRCDGSGWVVQDLFNAKACLCLKVQMARKAIGEDLWVGGKAVKIEDTPLYQPGGIGKPPEIDRTGERLFIRGQNEVLFAHLRRALGSKMLDTDCHFRLQVVTDERLKNVFVGNESYEKRSRKDRDQVETMNSLRDLIGGEYDLVVILLGYLGYKNVAGAGLLKEALMLRDSMAKATWVAERLDVAFKDGYASFSHDVAYYIEQQYETIDLEQVTGVSQAPVQQMVAEVVDVGFDEPPAPPVRYVAPTPMGGGAFGGSKPPKGKKTGSPFG